jgi:hypothetical protein
VRGNKLEEKEDNIGYYHNNKELQAYVKDMIQKDVNRNRGNIMRQNNPYIGELGLYYVSKDYKKIILLYETRSTSRSITINFPEEDIYSLYIKERTYNNFISYFFNINRHFHNSDTKLNNKYIYIYIYIEF